jgi:hypothetical protein
MKRDMKTLKAKIPVNKAGGGLVYNKNGGIIHFQERKMGFTKEEQKKEKISRAHQ